MLLPLLLFAMHHVRLFFFPFNPTLPFLVQQLLVFNPTHPFPVELFLAFNCMLLLFFMFVLLFLEFLDSVLHPRGVVLLVDLTADHFLPGALTSPPLVILWESLPVFHQLLFLVQAPLG